METAQVRMLFDIGAGTMRRLLESGTEIYDIDFVFLSHFHPDHSGELCSFLFSNKYPAPRRGPLTLGAGKGFQTVVNGFRAVYGDWIELGPDLLNLTEFDITGPDERRFEGFRVNTLPVNHNPESIAYRITTPDGASVVYSGDTDVSDNLITLSKGADLLICESALPEALKVKGHLTPPLAGEMASRAGVKKLVLTHFYPECGPADIEAECRKTYSGPLILAEDLMKIVVTTP
jgi:ribonuclease BN (tRNA processing enzyme)